MEKESVVAMKFVRDRGSNDVAVNDFGVSAGLDEEKEGGSDGASSKTTVAQKIGRDTVVS